MDGIPTVLPPAQHPNDQTQSTGFGFQALVNAAQANTQVLGQIQQILKNSYISLAANNTFTGNNVFTGITTFSGETDFKFGVTYPIRMFTASTGTVSTSRADYTVVVNKGSGSATTVLIYSPPPTGAFLIVKDGRGDASGNPITLTNGSFDGAASLVINSNYGFAGIQFNGQQWNRVT